MRKVDIVVAWLLIALGAVHVALTAKFDASLGLSAIWFACGGLLIITIGALNLLRVAYANVAKGVHIVSVIANFVLLLLMVWIAIRVPMRGNPQVAIGLILAGLLTVFSVLRRG